MPRRSRPRWGIRRGAQRWPAGCLAACAPSTNRRPRSSGCGCDPTCAARGLGQRLLTCLEDCARQLGLHRVLLDTNSPLLEAITMYERAGYQPIERYSDNPYAAHWFARQLG